MESSHKLGSYHPLSFHYGDTVGIFFSHSIQDIDVLFYRPYAIYDVNHPQAPVALEKLGLGLLDSHVYEPDHTEFLNIKNTENGFKLLKAHFGVIYSAEFSSQTGQLSVLKSFDTIPALSSYFNENLTAQTIKINQGFNVDNEIGVVGKFGGFPGTYFTMFFDSELNLQKIDSLERPNSYDSGYGLFKQNGTYVVYDGEMNNKIIYDDGWHQWENITYPNNAPIDCNSGCGFPILSIGNTIRVNEYLDAPLRFLVSNVNNLTAISEFTVPHQPNVLVSFLLHNETSFLTSVLNHGYLELWYHNMTDMSQKLLFSYRNDIVNPLSVSPYYVGGSLTETVSSYYIFWTQKTSSGVDEIYKAKIPKDFSGIEINQLSDTNKITDDYTDVSFFPFILLIPLILILIPVFLVIYIIARRPHTQNLPVQDLTYPEKKDNI